MAYAMAAQIATGSSIDASVPFIQAAVWAESVAAAPSRRVMDYYIPIFPAQALIIWGRRQRAAFICQTLGIMMHETRQPRYSGHRG